MSLVINTNIPSMTAQRHLAASRAEMEQAMERLSSGKRINSAMEDAAGLTIAHSLDTKIVSLQQAARNANDAISLIHLGEGAMDAVSSMLVRMRELATQAMNGTYSDYTDRANLDAEFSQLTSEITRVSDNTYFNGISVIGKTAALNFQIGYDAKDSIALNTQKISSETIGTGTGTYQLATAVPAALTNDPASGDVTTDSVFKIQLNMDVVNTAGKSVYDMNQTELKAAFALHDGTNAFTTYTVGVTKTTTGPLITITPDTTFTDDKTMTVTFTGLKSRSGVAFATGSVAFSVDDNGTTPTKVDASTTITGSFSTTTTTTDISLAAKDANGEPVVAESAYTLAEANLLNLDKAKEALQVVDDSLAQVDFYRVKLGAVANRLDYSVQNLYTRIENQMSARSRIEDADYAVESAALARAQVLQQAGTAMLAQANASTQNVLSLLK